METTQITLNKAIRYHQNGNLSKAESIYKMILKKEKANADAWHLLGVLFYQTGEYDIAVRNIKKAITLNADIAAFYSNLGLAYHENKAYNEAAENFKKALAIQPNYPEALNNLANTLRVKGYRGSKVYKEAMELYQKALALRPVYPDALNNLATLYIAEEDYKTALNLLERAVGFDPNFAKGYNNLGLVYKHFKQYTKAEEALKKALSLPNLSNRFTFNALFETKKESCSWEGLEAMEKELVERALVEPDRFIVDPFTAISKLSHTSKADQYKLIQGYVEYAVDTTVTPFEHKRKDKKRLKIGYISANFFDHPTMHLAGGLFESHDKERFEVYLYGIHSDEKSSYFKRAVAGSDHYTDISSMNDAEAAEKIYEDGIDILIDLMGLSKNARPQIFAYRSAPIQMQYLVFAGTTAHPSIDYIFTDRIITPESDAEFFSETFVYLPDTYQINDDKQKVADDIPTRQACGLPKEGFVYCCFNNAYKIEPMIFDQWMEILAAVPSSVLWLYESNETMKTNLKREAEKRGVDASRLIFANKLPKAKHLARLKNADLILDTYYFNAHTTASDALYVGVPMITCIGDRFASRVGASLLHAVGMEQCVYEDFEGYKKAAIRLAEDKAAYNAIKAELQTNLKDAPLFDTKRQMRNLEKGLNMAWESYMDNQKPTVLSIESEAA